MIEVSDEEIDVKSSHSNSSSSTNSKKDDKSDTDIILDSDFLSDDPDAF